MQGTGAGGGVDDRDTPCPVHAQLHRKLVCVLLYFHENGNQSTVSPDWMIVSAGVSGGSIGSFVTIEVDVVGSSPARHYFLSYKLTGRKRVSARVGGVRCKSKSVKGPCYETIEVQHFPSEGGGFKSSRPHPKY